MKNTKTLITHNGIFHADEVLAVALLKMFGSNEYNVIRTRDQKMLDKADILVDVGGEYEEGQVAATYSISQGKFDHHKFNDDDDYFGLSSAGLVFRSLTKNRGASCNYCGAGSDCTCGQDGAYDYYLLEATAELKKLVRVVDRHDTGIESSFNHPFIKAVGGMNSPSDINGEVQDKNFSVAVEYATAVVKRLQDPLEWDTVESVSSNLMGGWAEICPTCGTQPQVNNWELLYNNNSREKETLEKKIDETVASSTPISIDGVQVIVLHKGAPFVPVKRLIGLADLSVSWDSGQDCWTVQTIPLKNGEFGSRVLLTPMGGENEVFCHKGGFVGKYKECDGSIVFSVDGKKKEMKVS